MSSTFSQCYPDPYDTYLVAYSNLLAGVPHTAEIKNVTHHNAARALGYLDAIHKAPPRNRGSLVHAVDQLLTPVPVPATDP